MPDQHPFYRKRFWYQCALIEFRYFREEAETLARNAIATIPRAAPLLRVQSFLAESFDEFSIQFWFGRHPPVHLKEDQHFHSAEAKHHKGRPAVSCRPKSLWVEFPPAT